MAAIWVESDDEKSACSAAVMPGFMPGIHVLQQRNSKAWMAGTSPAMTAKVMFRGRNSCLY
jgi:hypothetical protein